MKGPLRRIITRTTMLVAVVAVVATAAAALPLLQAVDVSAARAAVATQADRLAAASADARNAVVAGLSALSDPDALVALVDADGSVHGSAASLVDAQVREQVTAGADVSTTVHRDRAAYAVEARPVAGGGAVVVAQDLRRVRSLGVDILGRVGLALAIGFAAAAVAALIASRRLSRPLAGLAAAARRIAGGDRRIVFTASPVDEIRDVERSLEAVGAALAHSESRQREFLLSVSHELRTPMTAIRGYASALRDGLVPPSRLAEVGETLDAEAARLSVFTDDLLALARLEADDFPIRPRDVELRALLADAEAAWKAVADTAGVAVVVDAGADAAVITDPRRVRQVVDGLVENALRVSAAGTRIRLDVVADADGAVISVADTGPGLSDDDLAHAFERGVLRDRYRDVRRVGSGLGLSIAARLTERLGGRISARAGAHGGTVFRIALPPAIRGSEGAAPK